MNLKKEIEKNTDIAWESLYGRLDRDGLLPREKNKERVVPGFATIRWVAAVVLITGLATIWTLTDKTDIKADMLVLHNQAGSPTLVATLEDGSIVYLSDRTSIHYPEHFAGNKREISLQGNAFFEITKQSERPFIIETQTVTIEVLGTSFNVKSRDDNSFSLSVRHGKVKVTSRATKESVSVDAGQTALFNLNNLHTIPTEDYSQFHAYMRRIHFKDQTLANIIRFINENTESVQLKIAPELEERSITVTFDNNTPDTMAMLICKYLNLEYSRQGNIIRIEPPK